MATRDRFRSTVVLLVGAMFAVVVSFIGSSVYTRQRLSHTANALSVATNAAPSIRYLTEARSSMTSLAVHVTRAASLGEGIPVTGVPERRLLQASLDAYLALPVYVGEREQQARLMATLGQLDWLLIEVPNRLTSDGISGRAWVFDTFLPAVRRVDDALRDLVDFNGVQLENDARAIRRNEVRYNAIAYSLNGLSLGLAILATALVLRAVRRFYLVLEKRSTQLEYFAVQIAHDIFNPLTPIAVALRSSQRRGEPSAVLERALRGVDRIQRNVEGLLAFAQASTVVADAGPAGIGPALAEVVADARGRGAAHVVVEPVVDRQVACSPHVLRRILREVVGYAIDAAADEVHVRAERRRGATRLEVSFAVPEGLTDPFGPRIRGADSGYPGIDLEMPTVRRMIEAIGGATGVMIHRARCILWVRLPEPSVSVG